MKVNLSTDLDKDQLKAEYTQTIADLQAIEDAPTLSNAQIISAVKYIAKVVRFLLKLTIKMYVSDLN